MINVFGVALSLVMVAWALLVDRPNAAPLLIVAGYLFFLCTRRA